MEGPEQALFEDWKARKLVALSWGKAAWFTLILLEIPYVAIVFFGLWMVAAVFQGRARVSGNKLPASLMKDIKKRC